MENPEKYVGIKKAADMLGVTTQTIKIRIKSGKTKGHVVVGGHHYFDTDALDRDAWGIKRGKRSHGSHAAILVGSRHRETPRHADGWSPHMVSHYRQIPQPNRQGRAITRQADTL